MNHNPVGWFEIYVADMARAKTFYEAVLQTRLEKIDGGTNELDMWMFPGVKGGTGASGALCRMEGFAPNQNSVVIYFTCEDCAVEEKRVVSAGGGIQKSKQSIGPYGFITLALDPEGHMFGLHSMK